MEKAVKLILLFIFMTLMPLHVMAQEESENYLYSPVGCDFAADFPFEPYIVQRCPSDAREACYDVAQYTHRVNFDQTINVEMSCNLMNTELYETYTQESLEEVLLNLIRDANLPETPPIQYQTEEENNLKIIGTSGLKTAGYSTKIFVSQIWLTPTSMMTVEGEMSIDAGDEGDKEFANILRSIRLVDAEPQDQESEVAEPSAAE